MTIMPRLDQMYLPAMLGLLGLLTGTVITWRIMRRKKSESPSLDRADAIFANVVAVLGTAASADGIWWALTDLGVTLIERIMFFAMLELGFIVTLRRAVRTLRETAGDSTRKVSTGKDGPAALAIILASGLIAATATQTVGGAFIRLAFAAIAGWTWWGEISRQLDTERARRRAIGFSATDPELDHDARYAARIRRRLSNAESSAVKRWLLLPWRLWLRYRFDALIDSAGLAIIGPMQQHLAKTYQAYEQTSSDKISQVVQVWSGPSREVVPQDFRDDFPTRPAGLPGRLPATPPTPTAKHFRTWLDAMGRPPGCSLSIRPVPRLGRTGGWSYADGCTHFPDTPKWEAFNRLRTRSTSGGETRKS